MGWLGGRHRIGMEQRHSGVSMVTTYPPPGIPKWGGVGWGVGKYAEMCGNLNVSG